MEWSCPVCGRPLREEERRLACPKGHSFDRAKSGYVNLLSGGGHAKLPGDNRMMVRARRDFLSRGYYHALAEALCGELRLLQRARGWAAPVLLDAGCGEGYYTGAAARSLGEVCRPEVYGVDISKFALDAAAKQNRDCHFAVASVFHLPVAAERADCLMSLFAPYCGEEYRRVLKPRGLMVLVIPARLHLWELKQAVYDRPYENAVKGYALEGFRFLYRQTVKDVITLERQEDIQNLFLMTPYYYKTSRQDQEKLLALERLTTRIAFEILVYERGTMDGTAGK